VAQSLLAVPSDLHQPIPIPFHTVVDNSADYDRIGFSEAKRRRTTLGGGVLLGLEASGDNHASASNRLPPPALRLSLPCSSPVLTYRLAVAKVSAKLRRRLHSLRAGSHRAFRFGEGRKSGTPRYSPKTQNEPEKYFRISNNSQNEPENEPERTRASDEANRRSPSESTKRLRWAREQTKRTRNEPDAVCIGRFSPLASEVARIWRRMLAFAFVLK
jgi:hypothetical protein